MSAIPSTPSTAATIRTDPGANAPTTPSLDTVAVPSFEDRHVTVRSVSGMPVRTRDRKSTRLNSSHITISYAVFCLKKKKKNTKKQIKKKKKKKNKHKIIKQEIK